MNQPLLDFDGVTYNRELDQSRLNAQSRRVLGVMLSGEWMTLGEISAKTGDPEASCSARLRDFRKESHGGHKVNRRRRGVGKRGLFEYQLIVRNP